jgi:hypothetical protein
MLKGMPKDLSTTSGAIPMLSILYRGFPVRKKGVILWQQYVLITRKNVSAARFTVSVPE